VKSKYSFLSKRNFGHNRGFTLIITISLLVLLTLVGIGLLSLSSLSLRASTQSRALSEARGNARMAMMIALGELQKSLGPDKAITATSEILTGSDPAAASVGKPNLTGVWSSWNFNPNDPGLNYADEKAKLFQRWLVSDANPDAVTSTDYPSLAYSADAVELVGKASLGGIEEDSQKVKAGRVPIFKNGKKTGNYAWHVADEAVKARINSYRNPAENDTLSKKRALLAGYRPDISGVLASDKSQLSFLPSDLDAQNYKLAMEESGKLIDLKQMDLKSVSPQIGKFRNNVTPYTFGVLADVRNGGLKQDLTSMFEGPTLPGKYESNKLYASTHGITGVSDPNWSMLSSYHNFYKKLTTAETTPLSYIEPVDPITLDSQQYLPQNFYPAPVIAKVEMLFTFVTRDAHWAGIKALGMQRMGHMVYTPLITLHNPYNVSVSFDRLQVSIRSAPVAFNFTVNGLPQNNELTQLNEFYINNGKIDRRGAKNFVLDIANWTDPISQSFNGPIVLKPGQTMVCGPYLNPAASFDNKLGSKFDDWENNATGKDEASNEPAQAIKGKPGFQGKAIGFDIDWLTPSILNPANSNDDNQGVLGLKPLDLVSIEAAIKPPSMGLKDRFQVAAAITIKGKTVSYGGLEFYYGDEATLNKYFTKSFRFPQQGSFRADEAYHSNATPLARQGNAKSFALFSAYARTTNGGVYETNKRVETPGALNALRDGRLAGKPYLDHNPAIGVSKMDMQKDVPGMFSHELNFVPLNGNVDDVFEIDVENRNSVVTGNTITKGLKSGTYLEVATGPLITIADFRRSNALTSYYLPNIVQPVANSRCSPLMSTNKVVEKNITAYALLDHSVLANHALYDSFYFSTIAAKNDRDVKTVFRQFMDGKAPLWSQAFQPYLSPGKKIEVANAEMFADNQHSQDAYQLAAEYQLIRGPFNVNSTSIQAWKAMLSSLNKSEIPVFWPKSLKVEIEKPYSVPVLPMSLVNGGVASLAVVNKAKIEDVKCNQWNGYRELTELQLDKLATEIVAQVKSRGPFLSLSEFVNRQIGYNSELTRSGALQNAIDKSKINDGFFTTQVMLAGADLNKPLLYRNKTVENVMGNPAEGAPGWISQGDLMRIIEPLATVRSDTFVIRTCGEATDENGKIIARAFAEAVVQRLPDYVNPVDRPSVNVYTTATANTANKFFGRRINIVSFRWLSGQEV